MSVASWDCQECTDPQDPTGLKVKKVITETEDPKASAWRDPWVLGEYQVHPDHQVPGYPDGQAKEDRRASMAWPD